MEILFCSSNMHLISVSFTSLINMALSTLLASTFFAHSNFESIFIKESIHSEVTTI